MKFGKFQCELNLEIVAWAHFQLRQSLRQDSTIIYYEAIWLEINERILIYFQTVFSSAFEVHWILNVDFLLFLFFKSSPLRSTKLFLPEANPVLGELINQFPPIRKERSNKKNPYLLMDFLAVCSTHIFSNWHNTKERERGFRKGKVSESRAALGGRASTGSCGGDGIVFN